jgi:DNA-binding MarR family transcriptional regulator
MNLKLEILRALDFGSRNLVMPETTLLNQARVLCTPVPTVTEFRRAISELELDGLIVSVRDTLDAGKVKYRITDGGRAEVASRA